MSSKASNEPRSNRIRIPGLPAATNPNPPISQTALERATSNTIRLNKMTEPNPHHESSHWCLRARQLLRYHAAKGPEGRFISDDDLGRARLLQPNPAKLDDDEEDWPGNWDTKENSLRSTFNKTAWKEYPTALADESRKLPEGPPVETPAVETLAVETLAAEETPERLMEKPAERPGEGPVEKPVHEGQMQSKPQAEDSQQTSVETGSSTRQDQDLDDLIQYYGCLGMQHESDSLNDHGPPTRFAPSRTPGLQGGVPQDKDNLRERVRDIGSHVMPQSDDAGAFAFPRPPIDATNRHAGERSRGGGIHRREEFTMAQKEQFNAWYEREKIKHERKKGQ
ncbi:hypothetical protein ColLi_13108 [Colletotrichum liriopes]|uniref:Uncharacterized protein n=1 Tax=Colletotrichum liriopes TaxID=708192 RepID=A0AA37H0W3_9PEZI|nr:hypothetical protein ColLi_13108 [Colletotrichum liriopes]